MSEKTNRTVIKATINYPALSQPKSINGSAAKYSGCFIIAKDDVESLNKYQEALEAAADKAVERKIGARGLRAVLEEVMTPVMYEVPSDESIAKVTITGDSIRNEGEPVLERQEGRPARPRLGAAALRAEKGGRSSKRGNAS